MQGSGFDWLNLPAQPHQNPHSADTSRTGSPTPPVSFGTAITSDTSLPNGYNQHRNYRHSNTSADDILNAHQNRTGGVSTSVEDVNIPEGSIPLSLTSQELTLPESRTYIRWYSDILARTNSRTISMTDIYNFLVNFKLSPELKENLNRLYSKTIHSINVGEFYAVFRIISHCLNGKSFSRKLIKVSAPIPTPPSILSKKRQNSDEEDDEDEEADLQGIGGANGPNSNGNSEDSLKPLDLDSFTQFMLTGQRPDEKPNKRKKKFKSVKFSDQVVTGVLETTNQPSPLPQSPPNELDYSLPMDQLLSRISNQSTGSGQYGAQDDEEQQILQDMGPQLNHFQNLNSVDTASIDGVPASIHLANSNSASTDQLLQPNMTGPAQMSNYLKHQQQQSPHQQDEDTKQDLLKPNRTGPYDMARMFSPTAQDQQQIASPIGQPGSPMGFPAAQNTPAISLQSFTDQMTGNTATNTMANARVSSAPSPIQDRPLPPPPVPASRRVRSLSSPTPPPPPSSRLSPGMGRSQPPPPPPARRRGATETFSPSPVAPPSLPPKVPQDYSGQIQAPNPQQFMPMPGELGQQQDQQQNQIYGNSETNGSTADILDDLKQLQAEVDRIRDMTGGF